MTFKYKIISLESDREISVIGEDEDSIKGIRVTIYKDCDIIGFVGCIPKEEEEIDRLFTTIKKGMRKLDGSFNRNRNKKI